MGNKTITAKDLQYNPDCIQIRGGGYFGFVKGVVSCNRGDEAGSFMEIVYDGLDETYDRLKECLEKENFEIIAGPVDTPHVSSIVDGAPLQKYEGYAMATATAAAPASAPVARKRPLPPRRATI